MARRQSIVAGVVLVLIGIWALLSSLGVPWANMGQLWPVILIVGGAAALRNALVSRPRQADGVWFGIAALLCGGIFLYVTVGAGEWSDLRTLWPIFPGIAGIAWVLSWVADLRQVSNLVTGLLALVVSALGFLYTSGIWPALRVLRIAQLWPLILVVMGIGLILQFLVQRQR